MAPAHAALLSMPMFAVLLSALALTSAADAMVDAGRVSAPAQGGQPGEAEGGPEAADYDDYDKAATEEDERALLNGMNATAPRVRNSWSVEKYDPVETPHGHSGRGNDVDADGPNTGKHRDKEAHDREPDFPDFPGIKGSYSGSNSGSSSGRADALENIVGFWIFQIPVLGVGCLCAYTLRKILLRDAKEGRTVEPPPHICRYCCGPFAVFYWEGCSSHTAVAVLLQFFSGICCYPVFCWSPGAKPLKGGLPVGPAVKTGGGTEEAAVEDKV
eukprot:TRINITY_DN13221_c0_g1_i1.p1 TRINITY_DN13221_c0_g1~~TRINITY_DN13221_c0_g1_i1.p1  ORF type:complete len:272 (-),score=52.21 TRINITY_DN13221_c0_g1_i1:529-1344(-)